MSFHDDELELYTEFTHDPVTRMIVSPNEGAPCIGFEFAGSWRECRIWEGYFRASQTLLKVMLDEGRRADNLIFPAMFNLRHAVEVALKWHIPYAGGDLPVRGTHSLRQLVEALQLTANDLDEEKNYVSKYAIDCTSELDQIDPRSITFRYSKNIDGSPIEISPQYWDLRRIYFTVDTLSLYFDNLSYLIINARY